MIAKCSEDNPCEWDNKLPHILFAYRASAQESTRESPFYLMYGQDPRIPTTTVLSQKRSVYEVDVDDYKRELILGLSQAWRLAQGNIKRAQAQQKSQYDRKTRPVEAKVGDRVMIYMPSEVQGKKWKLARPFHSPYRVIATTPSNAEVRLVDNPVAESLFVSWDRVHSCYPEQGNETWTGHRRRRRRKKQSSEKRDSPVTTLDVDTSSRSGPVTRSMTHAKQ